MAGVLPSPRARHRAVTGLAARASDDASTGCLSLFNQSSAFHAGHDARRIIALLDLEPPTRLAQNKGHSDAVDGGGERAHLRAPIYLDHHATTPMDPRVIAIMSHALEHLFGNPNSSHPVGQQAADAQERARADVAALAGVGPKHVHFTSGASDAIGKAFALALDQAEPRQVALMPVEHPAMLRAAEALSASGQVTIHRLDVDRHAQLVIASLYAALDAGADLVCLMLANNEVGTVYPVEAVIEACHAAGAQVMVDATQAAGRLALETIGPSVDYLVLSAHKIYGPKGVGALLTRHSSGRSDKEAHAGTPNVPAIVGFGAAARFALEERESDWKHCAAMRDRLQAGLSAKLPDLVVNGDPQARLPHSLHVSIPGIFNDAVLARIGHRVAISSGAACASGALEASHVLRAMALPEPLVEGALRLSTGRFTTEAEIDEAIAVIGATAAAIRETNAKGMTG